MRLLLIFFRYYIDGPKKSSYSELPLVLPGEPDNISKNKRGNYWVGIAGGRSKESPAIHDMVSEQPLIRKIFLISHKLLTAPITAIMNLIPHKLINEIGFEVRSLI